MQLHLLVVFGVIGIAAVVTGRTPKAVTKRLNWKKNLDKKALKVDKSQTNFLAPDEPDFEEENVSEDDEQEKEEIQTDGSIAIKEEIIYEEISEEEAGMTRRQFLGKALGITFGAFAGIQLISWLGFFYPKVSGGFGSKIDAGRVDDLKNQFSNQMVQLFLHSFQKQELMSYRLMTVVILSSLIVEPLQKV